MKKINLIKTMSTIGILGIAGVAISTTLTNCNNNDKPNLTLNSWEEFDEYFEEHHDEYPTPNEPLYLFGVEESVLIDYFFKEGRISGQNLLYSICQMFSGIVSAEISSSNMDTPLEMKIDVAATSASLKLTSDFEVSRKKRKAQKVNDSIQDIGIYYVIEKNSFVKIDIWGTHLDYEVDVAFLQFADSSKNDYQRITIHNKDSLDLDDSSVGVSAKLYESDEELLLSINFGDKLLYSRNGWIIDPDFDSISLKFNSTWYPDVHDTE